MAKVADNEERQRFVPCHLKIRYTRDSFYFTIDQHIGARYRRLLQLIIS